MVTVVFAVVQRIVEQSVHACHHTAQMVTFVVVTKISHNKGQKFAYIKIRVNKIFYTINTITILKNYFDLLLFLYIDIYHSSCAGVGDQNSRLRFAIYHIAHPSLPMKAPNLVILPITPKIVINSKNLPFLYTFRQNFAIMDISEFQNRNSGIFLLRNTNANLG